MDASGLAQLLHAAEYLAGLVLQQGVAALQHQRGIEQAQRLVGAGQPAGGLLQRLLAPLVQILLQALQLLAGIAQIALRQRL